MRIDVSCSTDNNYIQHCIAMLCSLFENNKNHEIVVHVLESELSAVSRHEIIALCKKYNVRVFFYKIDVSLMKNIQLNSMSIDGNPMYSIATYYRMLLPSLLGKEISKVLYLDCDVIVLQDVSSLFRLNMSEYGVAAVADVSPYDSYHRDKMGLPLNGVAFCAGVLMINLLYWRQNNIQEKLIEYTKIEWENVYMQDQDALNYVFCDKWFRLPFKWGKTPLSICVLGNGQKQFDQIEYMTAPAILHFAASLKPWLDVWTPDRHLYWEYLKKAKYEKPKVTKTSYKFKFKSYLRVFRYFLSKYVRPFVPDLLEVVIVDILRIVRLAGMVFVPDKFKVFLVKNWLHKYGE